MPANTIRVLHIIKSLGRGGAEMLLPETIKLHDKSIYQFHCIYFLPWKNQMVSTLEANGCRVSCFGSRTNIHLLLKVWQVAEYVRVNRIHLIHAHLPWAGVLARIVGKMTGVPVLYTEHNKQERYHFATRFLNLATMNWLTGVIAVSNDVAQSIQRNKANLVSPLYTVLNGVNTHSFRPGIAETKSIKASLGIPDSCPVIGTIAVFRLQKRLDIWLEVARLISDKFSGQCHFIIVGDGPLRVQIHARASELGIGANVHFAGLQTEVRPFLAAFDVYMMSSIFEGLPIAMLEAMSSGCPIVTTDAGGIKEVIRPGQDGLLCSVDKPLDLVDLCIQLLNDSDKRIRLGANARTRVVESFGMEAMVANLENLYLKLVRR
jgi:L-malate glycosyltransferase